MNRLKALFLVAIGQSDDVQNCEALSELTGLNWTKLLDYVRERYAFESNCSEEAAIITDILNESVYGGEKVFKADGFDVVIFKDKFLWKKTVAESINQEAIRTHIMNTIEKNISQAKSAALAAKLGL